jgi:general secretion pathway protein D
VFVNPDALTRRQVMATGDGDITLNFANADLREVVRSVLGDLLRLNYVIDPALQGSITMQTSRPLPREAVLPALESALHANGATLVEQDGLYRVLPIRSWQSRASKPQPSSISLSMASPGRDRSRPARPVCAELASIS